MLKRFTILWCALCVMLSTSTSAHAQTVNTYWVRDNGKMMQVIGNPDEETAIKEWVIELRTTDGSRVWGEISGDSAARVMDKLRRDQQFELRYCRWANRPCPDAVTTSFNPRGPIAIRNHPAVPQNWQRKAIDLAQKVDGMYRDYKSVEKNLDLFTAYHQKDKNPFAGIGNVLKEYTALLRESVARYHVIDRTLNNYESSSETFLTSMVEASERTATQVQVRAQRVIDSPDLVAFRKELDEKERQLQHAHDALVAQAPRANTPAAPLPPGIAEIDFNLQLMKNLRRVAEIQASIPARGPLPPPTGGAGAARGREPDESYDPPPDTGADEPRYDPTSDIRAAQQRYQNQMDNIMRGVAEQQRQFEADRARAAQERAEQQRRQQEEARRRATQPPPDPRWMPGPKVPCPSYPCASSAR